MKLITIIIPTYNRQKQIKQQLTNLLSEINRNNLQDFYEITIIDNKSDYDIYRLINHGFLEHRNTIKIIQRPINMGMGFALSMPFLECKTKWLWILSDDDLILADSLKHLKYYAEKLPDVAYFKFGVKNIKHEEQIIKTISDLNVIFGNRNYFSGDFIFISNNFYNLERLRPYLGYAVHGSNTWIPHILPILFGIIKKSGIVGVAIKHEIVKYIPPDKHNKWDDIDGYLSISGISDIKFLQDDLTIIKKIIIKDKSFIWILCQLSNEKSRNLRKIKLMRIYYGLFNIGFINKLLYILFLFLFYIRLNIFLVFYKIIIRNVDFFKRLGNYFSK